MKLAVMQPYFFPYLGYFHLLDSVDFFIVLEDVKYPKSSWINRNRILVNGQPNWITVPVLTSDGLIAGAQYNPAENFFPRLHKKLALAYANSPHLSSVLTFLQEWEDSAERGLAEVNMRLARKIGKLMGMNIPQSINSSELELASDLQGQDRILEICRIMGADTYVNLPGGRALYDQKAFSQTGTQLMFIKSSFAVYPQKSSTFVPGLSVLDFVLSQNTDLVEWVSGPSAYSLESPD